MENIKKIIIILVLVTLFSCRGNDIDNPEISIAELQEHIEYLASDELKGRLPGSEGDLKSAEYIRNKLESWDLIPMVNDGLQSFEIVAELEAGENNELLINGEQVPDDEFSPFAFSENTSVSSGLVFAGYGFDIESDTLNWNDYEDIDTEGKWVMILRGDPEIDNPSSMFADVSADRDKVMTAKDNGAAGVLLVSGKVFDSEDGLESLAKGENSTGIPAFRIKRSVANKILREKNETIESLEESLNNNFKPLSFELSSAVSGTSDLKEHKVTTNNVIMTLPGNDSILRDEYVIIGGHFDHLGMGGPGSSSRAVDTTGVHYGADDNASGIAAMLEIAEKFAAQKNNARSLVFSGFAAEEMGLLGSKYLVDNMPFDPDKVNAMINLDMVGRLKEDKKIQIGGVGTSARFTEIINANTDTAILKTILSEQGYGPSDHSAFYGKDIPVLFFSTGAHLDYHTPYDSPDKINYDGMVDITSMIYNISEHLASGTEKLAFREAGPKAQTNRGMRRKGVTLGIMPDFAGNIKDGLRADFVTPGRPADQGGMIKGDIIVSINGKPINNIQDYMFRLSKLEHGETIQVEVMREGKKELLLIAL